MKQSVMKKWVKALKSGKYAQGTSYLKQGSEYCCLGVLSSISPYKNNFTRMNLNVNDKSKNSVLPVPIRDWAGMRTTSGELNNDCSLTSMNDNGSSFEQLADFIEKHWKKL